MRIETLGRAAATAVNCPSANKVKRCCNMRLRQLQCKRLNFAVRLIRTRYCCCCCCCCCCRGMIVMSLRSQIMRRSHRSITHDIVQASCIVPNGISLHSTALAGCTSMTDDIQGVPKKRNPGFNFAITSISPSVCPSVCLSHAGIVPSRAKAGS